MRISDIKFLIAANFFVCLLGHRQNVTVLRINQLDVSPNII